MNRKEETDTERIGAWMTAVAAAGLVAGAIRAMTPEKGQKLLRFGGGLMVALAVLRPVSAWIGGDPGSAAGNLAGALSVSSGEELSAAQINAEEIVREQAEQYIAQVADRLGIPAEVRAVLSEGAAGTRTLASVTLFFRDLPQEEAAAELRRVLEQELGIPSAQQSWIVQGGIVG